MTDPSNKKSKDKRYRSDSAQRDSNLTVTPLTDFPDDEDAIDRLLMNTGFDADNEDETVSDWDALTKEPLVSGTTADFSKPEPAWDVESPLITKDVDSEQSAAAIEPTQNHPGEPRIEEISETPATDFEIESEPWLGDIDNDPDMIPIDIDNEDDSVLKEPLDPQESHPDGQLDGDGIESMTNTPKDASAGIADDATSTSFNRFKSDQAAINQQQAKLIENLEAKAKKAKILGYAALVVAVAAIIAAFALAMAAYKAQDKAQSEISRLSDMVSLIEEEMAGINEKNSGSADDESDSTFDPLSLAPESGSIETVPDVQQSQSNTRPKGDGLADGRVKSKPVAASAHTKGKSGWFVNLISFKQRSDAEHKAAQYSKKGVRAEIIEVEVNHAIWYRLRVGGFINKEQAVAYAEKIKKTLRLNSIWVAAG